MKNGTIEYKRKETEEWSGVPLDLPHEQDSITALVQHMVGQCSALLRQQETRKAKQGLLAHNQVLIDRIIRKFEIHIHPELLRILEEALNDGTDLLSDMNWTDRAEMMPDGVPEDPSQASADGVYGGTVQLRVEANESFRPMAQFVVALRQNSGFRLLQVVGSYKESVGIWLALRMPLCLKEDLLQMQGVSQVEDPSSLDPEGPEPVFHVRLVEDLSPDQARSAPSEQSPDKVLASMLPWCDRAQWRNARLKVARGNHAASSALDLGSHVTKLLSRQAHGYLDDPQYAVEADPSQCRLNGHDITNSRVETL